MVANRPEIQAMDLEEQIPILLTEIRSTDFIDMGIVDRDGNVHIQEGHQLS